MKFLPVKKLSHLSQEKLLETVKLFYSNIPRDEIAKSIGEDSFYFAQLPLVEIENNICAKCGTQLKSRFSSKAKKTLPFDESLNSYLGSSECPKCNAPQSKALKDNNILYIPKKKSLTEQRREKIIEYFKYEYEYEEITIEEISIYELMCLDLLISKKEISTSICFQFHSAIKIIPKFFSALMFQKLYPKCLRIDPLSPLNSFTFQENGIPKSFNYELCKFKLNIVEPESNSLKNIDLIIKNKIIRSYDNSFDDLISDVGICECLEFFENECLKLNLWFSVDDKIISLFKIILINFTPEQVFNIVYNSSKKVAYKLISEGISKKHAYNIFLYLIKNYAENSFINKWDIKEYNRINCCKKSLISLRIDALKEITT